MPAAGCAGACQPVRSRGNGKEGNKRRSAEILVSSVYFGDSKPKDDGSAGGKAKAGKDDDFQLPEGFGTGVDSFADLADDDGDLPF